MQRLLVSPRSSVTANLMVEAAAQTSTFVRTGCITGGLWIVLTAIGMEVADLRAAALVIRLGADLEKPSAVLLCFALTMSELVRCCVPMPPPETGSAATRAATLARIVMAVMIYNISPKACVRDWIVVYGSDRCYAGGEVWVLVGKVGVLNVKTH